MTYKDKEKEKASKRRYYYDHKEKYKTYMKKNGENIRNYEKKCNLALGLLHDNKNTMLNLLAYVGD